MKRIRTSNATESVHVPLSFQTGAGRQHWDAIVRLFTRIRDDCDEAARALGYTSKDDGVAAVEYVAQEILKDARGQRQQREENKKQEPLRKSGPHESTKRFVTEYDETYPREKEFQRAGASEILRMRDELKEMLRAGKTKLGATITPSSGMGYLNTLRL
jgi:hypothetical protein